LNVTPYGYNIGRTAHNCILQRLISRNLYGLKGWKANGFQDELVFLFYIDLIGVTFIFMDVGVNLGHCARYPD